MIKSREGEGGRGRRRGEVGGREKESEWAWEAIREERDGKRQRMKEERDGERQRKKEREAEKQSEARMKSLTPTPKCLATEKKVKKKMKKK